MGGVVNLVSRRPGTEKQREILVNRSTRGATDVVGFFGGPVAERWGLTLLGDGPLSYTLALFASRVAHPIHVDRSNGLVLTNLDEPATNRGVELLGTLRHAPFSVTATYTYVRSRETAEGATHELPLTPRHSAGTVGMWERENVGRVGLEWYYTGAQRLEENPFRATSEPYVIVGVLVERQFGRWRAFVNGENLGGVRQTRWDPLVRPFRAPDGRWTVDAWAPLEGRNINDGVRRRIADLADDRLGSWTTISTSLSLRMFVSFLSEPCRSISKLFSSIADSNIAVHVRRAQNKTSRLLSSERR